MVYQIEGQWWVDVGSACDGDDSQDCPVMLDFLDQAPCNANGVSRRLSETEETKVLEVLKERRKEAKKRRQRELAEVWHSQEAAMISKPQEAAVLEQPQIPDKDPPQPAVEMSDAVLDAAVFKLGLMGFKDTEACRMALKLSNNNVGQAVTILSVINDPSQEQGPVYATASAADDSVPLAPPPGFGSPMEQPLQPPPGFRSEFCAPPLPPGFEGHMQVPQVPRTLAPPGFSPPGAHPQQPPLSAPVFHTVDAPAGVAGAISKAEESLRAPGVVFPDKRSNNASRKPLLLNQRSVSQVLPSVAQGPSGRGFGQRRLLALPRSF